MDKIPFVDGTKIKNAKVTVNEQEYEVTPAQYQGTTPVSAFNLNKMQDNIEKAIPITNTIKVSATEPSPKADVWIKYAKNIIHNNWRDGFRIGLDGNLFADETYSSTDFIEVKSNTKYIANWELEATQCIGYYTTEKNFISRNTTDNAFTTPENCKYIRAARLISDKNIAKITLYKANDDILINNDGIYNSIFNIQDYTLNKERKIGKWINGEDLYQVTVKGNTPKTEKDGVFGTPSEISLQSYNVKEAYIKNAWLKDGYNNLIPLFYSTNNGSTVKCNFVTNDKAIYINNSYSGYSNREVIITVMYTKNN